MSKKNKTMLDQVEEINETNFMDNLKSNDQLKKVLLKARNITKNLSNVVVPQMASAIKNVMSEMLENKTEISDWKTMKFLRGHCYAQSG